MLAALAAILLSFRAEVIFFFFFLSFLVVIVFPQTLNVFYVFLDLVYCAKQFLFNFPFLFPFLDAAGPKDRTQSHQSVTSKASSMIIEPSKHSRHSHGILK